MSKGAKASKDGVVSCNKEGRAVSLLLSGSGGEDARGAFSAA